MTKIGKKLAAVLLAVAMVVTFVPMLGTQTAYAEGETEQNLLTISAVALGFTTPVAGTSITAYRDGNEIYQNPRPIVTVSEGAAYEIAGDTAYYAYNSSTDLYEITDEPITFADGRTYYVGVVLQPKGDAVFAAEDQLTYTFENAEKAYTESTETRCHVVVKVTAVYNDSDHGECGDGVFWSLSDSGQMTIYGSGQMDDYATHNAPWYGSHRNDIRKVVIGEGVTHIGNNAFYYCSNVGQISIASSVRSIGDGAFENCFNSEGYTFNGSMSVTIPGTVRSIGKRAFDHCYGIGTLTLGEGLQEIKDGAFSSCTSIRQLVIPDSVTSLGTSAVANCTSLTSITLPSGLTTISPGLLEGCEGLPSVQIPNGVTSIGRRAFLSCSKLQSIEIPEGVMELGDEVFLYCRKLENIIFPQSLTTIGESTFDSTKWLENQGAVVRVNDILVRYQGQETHFSIPEGVASIAGGAFERCTTLESISIPVGVTSIGSNAFDSCSALTEITIPDGVISIGNNAFYYCQALADITIPASVTSMVGDYMFYNCSPSLVIHGYTDSTAHQYAQNHGISFEAIGEATQPIKETTITIAASNVTKTYGDPAFRLGAKTDGDGILTYKSGNTKVADVNNAGVVTVKGTGTAKITVSAAATDNYAAAEKTITLTVNKAANPLAVKAKTATVKYSKLKKKNQTLAVTKVIIFTKKGQGTMSYTKASGNKKITINKKTGKVTIKKGLKKGTYKVKVKVKAAGNTNYKPSVVKTVTFKIKVK